MTEASGRSLDADRPTVLIVDDEAVARRAYERAFQRARFLTCEAPDGPGALQQLATRHVDAVVLDQQMPGMTGMHLMAAIRSLPLHDRTPVLFVSGDGNPDTRIRALQTGATDFMVKPIVLPELVARVEAQLRVATTWQSSMRGLLQRAETVAALAGVGTSLDPAATAAALCERISVAQGGAPVGLYGCRSDGMLFRLASIGEQPSFVGLTATGTHTPWLRQRVQGDPWVEHESGELPIGGLATWWACAPLRQGSSSLGILVLGGPPAARGTTAIDQAMAAAVDYAAVTALHLELGLTDAHSLHEKKEAVLQILSDHTFWPVFQPILRLENEALIGYEALTRFQDGRAPDQRLADAAEVGLAADLELAMLSAALRTGSELRGDVWLSVNVSPSVLIERNAQLMGLIAECSHPLVIELTEHNPIEDYEVARKALARLGPGVRLSVDDAGAGFASLRHVVDLHPQFLKLDRSWVTGIEHDDARQALVAGLMGFAARTRIDVIAEGIETFEEKTTLEQLEVPFGQGYLLGKPQTLAHLSDRDDELASVAPVPPV